jgi:calcineurin-like phosphoesterase family protein
LNYYISDLHLFCKSVLSNGRFKERPFNSLEEMHETIKNNWNSVVTNSDHVYILGDNSKRGFNNNLTAFLSQLKGNLHLIRGNHDDVNDLRMKKQFVEICDYKEISDSFDGKSYKLVLCHYPIYAWNGQNRGSILLYGHCHDNFDDKLFQKSIKELNDVYKERDGERYIEFHAYNVGCMHWNYTPVTLKQIILAEKSENKKDR